MHKDYEEILMEYIDNMYLYTDSRILLNYTSIVSNTTHYELFYIVYDHCSTALSIVQHRRGNN